jgi:tight adherence protein C
MTPALLAGATLGAGLYCLVRLFVRPQPGVASLVARIDAGRRSLTGWTASGLQLSQSTGPTRPTLTDRLGERLEVLAAERGWQLKRIRSDLAILNQPLGNLLAAKVLTGLALFVTGPACWTVLVALGAPVPFTLPMIAALALGLLGFFLPDIALRSQATERRREFRRAVGIFLDLVAMNLAGGRGLPEAMLAASTVSDHWSVVRIRQALANARLLGLTPWEGLGALGEEIAVDELRDLSGALSLASDDGAKIRASLSARAATLRRRELAEAEGDAGEQSQSMLVAQMLICTAFLLFLGYPALAQLMLGTR